MTAITAENLSYRYPFCETPSLDGVSFTLAKGEAMLVTGASGCGKSTLLRILNGLIPNHFRGKLEGKLKVLELDFPALLGEVSTRVGTVLQNPEEQIMATTVQEEVALALEWQCVPQDEIRRRVGVALDAFDLTRLAARSVFNLSSGERQKCVLAAVMASGADVVVMDEPTANLSPEATEDLAKLCLTLKSHGVTLVIVDHRLYWLRGVLDKLLVLKDGKVVHFGRAVAPQPPPDGTGCRPYSSDPLDALAAHPDFATWGLRSVNVSRPQLPAAGRAVAPRPPQSCAPAGTGCPPYQPAVIIHNLSFRYSKKSEWIYRDFSAVIPQGAITAVVGANGAGKTTLARLLCGLLKPTSGEITFTPVCPPTAVESHLGRAVAPRPPFAALSPRARREQTAFVMQQMDIQLYMRTVEEELLFSAPRRLDKSTRRADATHWLEVFGLAHLKNRHPHSLSGGEKQRLVVACALMKRPTLMILDEPTSGLDGNNMRIIARELKAYAAQGGSVLIITHDLELLSLIADYQLEIKHVTEPGENV